MLVFGVYGSGSVEVFGILLGIKSYAVLVDCESNIGVKIFMQPNWLQLFSGNPCDDNGKFLSITAY